MAHDRYDDEAQMKFLRQYNRDKTARILKRKENFRRLFCDGKFGFRMHMMYKRGLVGIARLYQSYREYKD